MRCRTWTLRSTAPKHGWIIRTEWGATAGMRRRRFCCASTGMLRASHILGEAGVPLVNLNAEADALPRAWSSRVLERFGGGNFKVLRMDGTPYPNEVHGYAEGFLV